MNSRSQRPLAGILNIDKPANITSHDVIKQVRRLTGIRKVGHAGTLDPLATGVLLVCIGQATRLIEYLMVETKVYRATVRFGQATDTYDAEGTITAEADTAQLTQNQVEQILPAFVGRISQVPPVYSALKKQGVPLYKLARQGVAVTPEARMVQIEVIQPVAWSLPVVVLDITCQTGTYIRSLAHDLGQALSIGAHLTDLRRLRSGAWSVEQAITLETLAAACQADNLLRVLQPKEKAVTSLPVAHLDCEAEKAVRYGQRIERPDNFEPLSDADQPIAGYNEDGQLVAILQAGPDGLLKPKKVF